MYFFCLSVDSLTPEELEGVLAHEVLHCALAHHCRRGTREPRLWNEATDFAINPIVLKNGLALPADALIKDEYEGLSAEEIYPHFLSHHGSEFRLGTFLLWLRVYSHNDIFLLWEYLFTFILLLSKT